MKRLFRAICLGVSACILVSLFAPFTAHAEESAICFRLYNYCFSTISGPTLSVPTSDISTGQHVALSGSAEAFIGALDPNDANSNSFRFKLYCNAASAGFPTTSDNSSFVNDGNGVPDQQYYVRPATAYTASDTTISIWQTIFSFFDLAPAPPPTASYSASFSDGNSPCVYNSPGDYQIALVVEWAQQFRAIVEPVYVGSTPTVSASGPVPILALAGGGTTVLIGQPYSFNVSRVTGTGDPLDQISYSLICKAGDVAQPSMTVTPSGSDDPASAVINCPPIVNPASETATLDATQTIDGSTVGNTITEDYAAVSLSVVAAAATEGRFCLGN